MAGKVRAAPPGAARVAHPLRRVARLLIGRSALRRPSDRVEGFLVLLLSAVFLAAVAEAPFLAARIYHSQRAAEGRLHPAEAVLTRSGPADADLNGNGTVSARWRAPGGRVLSGTLTTVTAPGIWGEPAGARVPVWLSGSGEPAPPPPGQFAVIFTAVVIAAAAACGAGIAAIICYWLCRMLLDRHRMAGWGSAWALTGPRWTTRR